jgi:hypothetical protein
VAEVAARDAATAGESACEVGTGAPAVFPLGSGVPGTESGAPAAGEGVSAARVFMCALAEVLLGDRDAVGASLAGGGADPGSAPPTIAAPPMALAVIPAAASAFQVSRLATATLAMDFFGAAKA